MEKCKLLEKKIDVEYVNKNQIRNIVKLSERRFYLHAFHRLLRLFYIHVDIEDYPNILRLILEYKDDDIIYKKLREFITPGAFFKAQYNPILMDKCNYELMNAQTIYYKIKDHVRVNNYLDIGGDKVLTKILGDLLKVSTDKSDKYSLVSALLILHRDNVLDKICNLLESGGYLLLKEYSCENNIDRMLVDIKNGIYNITYCKKKREKLNCKSREEWNKLLSDRGFELIYSDWMSNSIIFNLSPCRIFFSIYKYK